MSAGKKRLLYEGVKITRKRVKQLDKKVQPPKERTPTPRSKGKAILGKAAKASNKKKMKKKRVKSLGYGMSSLMRRKLNWRLKRSL